MLTQTGVDFRILWPKCHMKYLHETLGIHAPSPLPRLDARERISNRLLKFLGTPDSRAPARKSRHMFLWNSLKESHLQQDPRLSHVGQGSYANRSDNVLPLTMHPKDILSVTPIGEGYKT